MLSKIICKTKEVLGLKNSDFSEEPDVVDGEIIIKDSPYQSENKENSQAQEKGNREVILSTETAQGQSKEMPDIIPEVAKGRTPNIKRFFVSLGSAGFSKRTLKEYKYEQKWWTMQASQKKKACTA